MTHTSKGGTMTASAYLVHTPNGYVGRMSLSEDLRDDMPKGFAYCYDLTEAEALAERFNGEAVAL